MSRKGQAALEFMMTYGWAILVVLAAIGALSYFGVLNPARLTPETCLTSTGFGCLGKPIMTYDPAVGATDTVTFTISNGLGYNIDLLTANMIPTGTFADTLKCDFAGAAAIEICNKGDVVAGVPGPSCAANMLMDYSAEKTIIISGCDFSTLTVVKGDITLNYANPQSGLQETMTVTVTAKVPK